MQIKVKLNHPLAKMPTKAHSLDAGFDLYSVENHMFYKQNQKVIVNTGIIVSIPEGHVGLICPRSGLAFKNNITILNAPGIVDSGFNGEVKVCLISTTANYFDIFPGDRIAQLLIQPIVQVELIESVSVDLTERAKSGFGSTGR